MLIDSTEFEHVLDPLISVYLSYRLLRLGTVFLSKFLFYNSIPSEEV